MSSLAERKHLTEELRSRIRANGQIRSEYEFEVGGRVFVGHPNVFAPPIFPSARLWPRIPVRGGETVLEVGTGTGIYAVLAALDGARRVVAVDVNPQAVANALENARRHNVHDRVESYVSDVFDAIPADDQFDVIFWNIPWCYVPCQELSMLERAIFDPDLRLLRRYLCIGARHLAPGGRLLLAYSATHGEVREMQSIAAEHGWTVTSLSQTADGEAVTGDLFELRPSASSP